MADVQEMTPKQFADGFYARLKDKDSKFSPFRKFTVDLMKQYPQGIPDDVLAQRASKELPVFAGVKINAGGQASDQQVKQDADKINSTVGTALTKPLVDYAHASEGVEKVKETARGWQQGVPAGGEHTLGQLGTTVGQVTAGVLTGLTEAGIQMTSPSNLALLAASFGLNKIKQGAKLIPIIKAMAAGTFSAEMLKDLATEIPEAKKYLEHGDAVGFGNAVGRGLADLTIGVKTGKEAYKGSKAAITNGAPNVEAPPAARTEATPEEQISKAGSTEDVRTIPKEHLRAAYETAVQQNAELRPRLERAQTGAREARTKLQDYQTKLEELEFSPTPPDAKVVEHVKKTIATQKQHVESLEQRSREIGDDYKKWQRTLLEARDRAVHEKAPWYSAEPPVPRRAPSQQQLPAGQEPRQIGAGQAVAEPPVARPINPAQPQQTAPPYEQPGQPQAGISPGQQQAQLPPSTQPFQMMGEQPPMPHGRQVEGGPEQKQLAAGAPPHSVRTASVEKPTASVAEVAPKPAVKEAAVRAAPAVAAKKAEAPPKSRTEEKAKPAAKKTAAPPKGRKEEPATAPPRTLTAGTRYVVKDTNPDLGLYKGETVIYRGPHSGKYGFDVIDPDTGRKSLMQIEATTSMKDILENLDEEGGEKKKRPGDKHLGDSPPKDGPLAKAGDFIGEVKNKVGEWLGGDVSPAEAAGEKVPQGEGDYSVAYSRTTHRPLIMAHSQEQMDKLAGGDYGATFLKPGDVGVGGGPLAQVVRKSLESGPVSVIGPDVAQPLEPGIPGKMQGTVQHEVIHQVLGDTKVSSDKLLAALPADIAEPLRAHLTKNFAKDKWAEEIPAHLGASGVNAPGSDPRINQAETIGLSPEQAQKAWQVYLSLLAKQDPKKAAKLKAHMGANPDTTPPAPR